MSSRKYQIQCLAPYSSGRYDPRESTIRKVLLPLITASSSPFQALVIFPFHLFRNKNQHHLSNVSTWKFLSPSLYLHTYHESKISQYLFRLDKTRKTNPNCSSSRNQTIYASTVPLPISSQGAYTTKRQGSANTQSTFQPFAQAASSSCRVQRQMPNSHGPCRRQCTFRRRPN